MFFVLPKILVSFGFVKWGHFFQQELQLYDKIKSNMVTSP